MSHCLPPLPFNAEQADRISREAVEQLADAVAAMIQVTRALTETDRQVDLGGLERIVGRLCASALDLPPQQGQQLRPRLTELLGDLDALAAALAARSAQS